jgi:predicted P-loop ATPase
VSAAVSLPRGPALLERVLAWLSIGPVFPLITGEKCPDPDHAPRGVYSASRDVAQVRRWLDAGVRDFGVAMGHELESDEVGTGRYAYCVDVDPRNDGDVSALGCDVPTTVEQRTQSGGAHYIVAVDAPRSHTLSKGIDGLGAGKYIKLHVSPPMQAPDAIDVADAPAAWRARILRAAAPATVVVTELDGADTVLGYCCKAMGLLGAAQPDGSYLLCCPLADEHSDGRGRGRDDSCVLLAQVEGARLGAICCKHSHGHKLAKTGALEHFPSDVVREARATYPLDAVTHDAAATEAALPTPVVGSPLKVCGPLLSYVQTKSGEQKVEKVGTNITTILRHDPRWTGVIVWDEFSQVIRFTRPPPWHDDDRPALPSKVWSDSDVTRLCNWLQREWKLDMPPAKVLAAVVAHAESNATNPVTAWLDRLAWDRQKRLDHWLDHLGVAPTAYSKIVGAKWMISAVARAYRPGCKVDTLMVLEGPQGRGKSTALAALVPFPEWFADTPIPIGSKDAYLSLHGKWIIELGELASLTRAEVEKVKAFFSSPSDYYRPPYGRANVDVPRRCVFAGTTNRDEYLKDDTGNRRYFPIAVGVIDLDGLKADREQLWAEAVVRYKAGETWWPSLSETSLFEAEQEAREEIDPWTNAVAEWLKTTKAKDMLAKRGGYLTTADVLEFGLHVKVADIDKAKQMRVGRILSRSVKWGRHSNRIEGARVWGYSPP